MKFTHKDSLLSQLWPEKGATVSLRQYLLTTNKKLQDAIQVKEDRLCFQIQIILYYVYIALSVYLLSHETSFLAGTL